MTSPKIPLSQKILMTSMRKIHDMQRHTQIHNSLEGFMAIQRF